MAARQQIAAIAALLTGASVWGLIWYPYRIIEQAGIGGIGASLLTYAVALVLGVIVFRNVLRTSRLSWWLVAIGLASGGCNLGYVIAVLHGEVMRVLLLFYLSPLWTVLLSRLLLDERLGRDGALVIALALMGAVIMLWHPRLGLPWPDTGAEWVGLGAGFMFALQNVLIRKADHLPIELKSLATSAGVVLLAGLLLPMEPGSGMALPEATETWLLLVLVIGVVLLLANLVVQFGLMRVPANQAIVIFLFELVVAAISSWALAGESMGVREWVGGGLIIAASFFSGRMAAEAES